ncbi:MAG: phytanoyl-CoA dioxygenase family protein [Caldilineaceae bacterium]|nr:phytanoyl-CoA dioxygenase family protein [Caldilineaceae bacterium]
MATVSTARASHANGSPDKAAAHGLEMGNGLIAGTASPERVKEFYTENGYYILPDALTLAEVEELRAETTAICKGERGDVDGFEPNVPGEDEDDVLRRYLCIHFPHKISEVMLGYLGHRHIAEVLTQVIGPNVKCMQSMLFIKATGKPGQAWHQDEFFIPTRDRTLTGAWIALDDATIENGCLWVIPGSHKRGIIWPQHDHDDPRFDCAGEAYGFPYSDEDSIPVEVKAGALVFFNGYLLHRSFPNRAQSGYRRVLVNHYMSAESYLPWRSPKEDEHMATADYRDVVMIAGEDPYPWKAYEEMALPKVRPSGEGGCENWRRNPKREKLPFFKDGFRPGDAPEDDD